MKKLILLLLTLTVITACDVEPLDPAYTQGSGSNGGGGNNGSESGDLTLSLYELDTELSFDFFGTPVQTNTKSDFSISNNKIASAINQVSLSGSPFVTENQQITRNGSGQIISDISVNSAGVTTNEYIITYTNGVVSNITYDYYEDDFDDYNYNFTYDGNTITRTKVGSTISTVFTVDSSDRVIKKESFDGDVSIQTETISYNTAGNITSSTTTGETQSNTTYQFDNNINPLKVVYEDNYLLSFLRDEYSDEIGPQIAQFLSTNNWNAATFNGESATFDLEYNSAGRITKRDMDFNSSPELSATINERFTYVN
ncbi:MULTISPECIES: hypothetical protein [Winogradskyella]|uniref:YD repeat-containing protein n=1 Tax=Winogradskyella damuponensis TaxID=943939 RepID=A0ABP8CLF8_9FLAO